MTKSLKLKALLSILLCFTVGLSLTGCNLLSMGNTYTVSYSSSVKCKNLPDSITVKEGTVLTSSQLIYLTSDEYDFIGWYDGDTKAESYSYTVTKDVTLTAKWKAKTVSFYVNYYTDSTDIDDDSFSYSGTEPFTATIGSYYQGPEEIPDGFTLTDFTETKITKAEQIVKVYLKRNLCALTFETNNSDVATPEPLIVKYGTRLSYSMLPDFTATSEYRFLGWEYNNYTASTLEVTQDMTLNGQWFFYDNGNKTALYTLSFMFIFNDGTQSSRNVKSDKYEGKVGSIVTQQKVQDIVATYMTGYATMFNGFTFDHLDGNTVIKSDGTTSITAYYKQNTTPENPDGNDNPTETEAHYNVYVYFETTNGEYTSPSIYNAPYGTGIVETEATYDTFKAIEASQTYKDQFTGYEFDYLTGRDSNGNDNSDITIKEDDSTKINAYYKRKIYSIQLDANGGTFNSTQTPLVQGKYGTTVTIDQNLTPTKEGYIFAGWEGLTYTNSNGYNATVKYGYNNTPSTLTAKWIKPTAGIQINIPQISGSKLTITSTTDDNSITFTASTIDNSIITYINWYLDDTYFPKQKEKTFTVDTSTIEKGWHTITCMYGSSTATADFLIK